MSKLVIFLFILFLFKTETVFSASSIYDVNNIKITTNNKLKDNQKFIDEAFKKAFVIFINRILLPKDVERFNNLDLKNIKNFIFAYQIYEIDDEDELKNTIGINVKFDQKKISNFFSQNNISYSDVTEVDISIFPILKKGNNVLAFTENLLYNNWNDCETNQNDLETKSISYNLALENVEDLYYINKNIDNLELINLDNLSSLKEQKNKVLLIFYFQEKNKLFLKAFLNNKEIIKNVDLNLIENNSIDENKNMILIAKKEIEQIWKELNLININTPSYLDISLDIKQPNDLNIFKNVLEKIDIIENNSDFIVINKKSGLPVQGGTKVKENLINILSNSKFFENAQPYIVHRIDKDTSGVLIIAKNRTTAQQLTSLFRIRKIHKSYIAISIGNVDKKKYKIDNNLIRYEKNKKIFERAVTEYQVIDENNKYTFFKLKPITGRKHQIRKHLVDLNCPIVGDKKYFIKKPSQNNFLMLHAYEIKFILNNRKYTFKSKIPEYFKNFLIKNNLKHQDF